MRSQFSLHHHYVSLFCMRLSGAEGANLDAISHATYDSLDRFHHSVVLIFPMVRTYFLKPSAFFLNSKLLKHYCQMRLSQSKPKIQISHCTQYRTGVTTRCQQSPVCRDLMCVQSLLNEKCNHQISLDLMVDTVNPLKFSCTHSPASLVIAPWTTTWPITLTCISSDS